MCLTLAPSIPVTFSQHTVDRRANKETPCLTIPRHLVHHKESSPATAQAEDSKPMVQVAARGRQVQTLSLLRSVSDSRITSMFSVLPVSRSRFAEGTSSIFSAHRESQVHSSVRRSRDSEPTIFSVNSDIPREPPKKKARRNDNRSPLQLIPRSVQRVQRTARQPGLMSSSSASSEPEPTDDEFKSANEPARATPRILNVRFNLKKHRRAVKGKNSCPNPLAGKSLPDADGSDKAAETSVDSIDPSKLQIVRCFLVGMLASRLNR